MPAVLALVLVTAVWGVTFVQVKDAVALYPLFAFLAVRFWIATLTLAVPGLPRVRSLGRPGFVGGAFLGLLLAAGYTLQTAGLERTTVSSTGFITGMYVVLTPLIALVLVRSRIGLPVWGGVVLSTIGLAMLSGIHAGSVSLQRRSVISTYPTAGRSGAPCLSPASSRAHSPFSCRPGRSGERRRPAPLWLSRWSRSGPRSSATPWPATGWGCSDGEAAQ